jgi:VIT1/CCC1 family predicted Fe2+/Mn2+ transporter
MAHLEFHVAPAQPKLNWLRAGVLGANDGIVSIAGLIFGVAGATTDSSILLSAGIAGIVAGALSMAVGEYVSVSSSRDSEQALLAKERFELAHFPEQEFKELQSLYEKKGLSPETARKVAEELSAHDVFTAHADIELKIDPKILANPLHASISSGTSFFAGAIVPLLAITIPPQEIRLAVAFCAVLVALSATGYVSAYIGGAPRLRAMFRVVLGGILAMLITFGIGALVGTVL